jgi:hypothetical protein
MPIARIPASLFATLCVAACSAPASVDLAPSDVLGADDVADDRGPPGDASEQCGDAADLDALSDDRPLQQHCTTCRSAVHTRSRRRTAAEVGPA